MYSPWLIVYTENTIQQLSANWIRQLVNSVNGKVLYPWSEQQTDSSRIIIKNFIRTLIFVLENLPSKLFVIDMLIRKILDFNCIYPN